MNVKNKTLTASMIFLGILLASTLTNVALAFTYVNITLDATYAADSMQNQFLQHSSGNMIYAYFSETTNQFKVYQYDATGTLDANTSVSPNPNTMWYKEVTLKVVEINATYVVIGAMLSYDVDPGISQYYFNTIFWNVTAHIQVGATGSVQLTTCDGDGSHNNFTSPLDAVIYSNLVHFLLFNNVEDPVTEQNFAVCTFNIATQAVLYTDQVLPTLGGPLYRPAPLFAHQNPDALDQVYFITSRANIDIEQPSVYRVDLDVGATSIELMTTNLTNRFSNDLRTFRIGSGITYDSGFAYLYFDIVRPEIIGGTERSLMAYSFGMEFTAETIDLAHLNDTCDKAVAITPTLPGGAVNTWCIGYSEDELSFTLFFPHKTGSVYYVDETEATFDFYNFADTSLSLSAWTLTEQIPIEQAPDIEETAYSYTASWTALTTWRHTIVTDYITIYYYLQPQGANYDTSLTWLPFNDPLYTEVNYRFTGTATINGIAISGIGVKTFLGENELNFIISDANGQVNYFYIFHSLGAYSLDMELYQAGELVYEEEHILVVGVDTEEGFGPQVGTIMPGFFAVFTGLFPGFIIVAIPAFFLGQAGKDAGVGQMGFIFGAILGVGLGFMLGLIPATLFYLMILLVAVLLVMTIKRRF